MSEQSTTKRTSPRKRKVEDKPVVHLVPIEIEKDDKSDQESTDSNLETKVKSSTEDIDSSSEGSSICSGVKQMDIKSRSKETVDENDTLPERILPPYNVPEKIIIVFDAVEDEVRSMFELEGNQFKPSVMIKRSLLFFLENKHQMDKRHEFALVVLNVNTAIWVHDFTSDISEIISALNEIDGCHTEDIVDLNGLFKMINEKIEVPSINGNIPPSYVVRTIFVYGRSFSMPQFTEMDLRRNLLESPYFTLDILMTHEIPCTSNNCQKIFEYLQNIDKKGFSYFFPVARNAYDLHISVAKLLGHPLQRFSQDTASYKIVNVDS